MQADLARALSRKWRSHQRSNKGEPVDLTIGFAASFTIDALLDCVGGRLLQGAARNPRLLNANYNQIARVCLDPSSEFGEVDPDVIVVMWRLEDLADPSQPNMIDTASNFQIESLRQLRSHFGGTIVVGLPPRPRGPIEGVTEFSRPSPLQSIWYRSLSDLASLVSEANIYAIDLEAEIARLGEPASLDCRKEYLYRQPFTEGYFAELADQIVRICEGRKDQARKCVVVDCDNTLWGGVIGEDGVAGIELSEDYPGRPFRDFQKQLKSLRDSGIFLALCSKNNPSDVEELFKQHSAMVLSLDDVSVAKINWRPKSENLREIAAELNIGLDALVFVDDNPFEIEEVRTHAPEVLCLQVPADIAEFPGFFREKCRHFDRLDITNDDRRRVDMQRLEVERRELHQKLTEADFLATLGLTVELKEPGPSDFARVTQLINKTNQFNVTTRRYAFEEVAEMARDPKTHLYCASVSDRFGDYGLVGIGIVRDGPKRAVVDTVLMSCRVLGRGVETALLAHCIERAAERGFELIEGRYIPTRKNAMVEQLFPRHEFETDAGSTEAEKIFTRTTRPLNIPAYLTVIHPGELAPAQVEDIFDDAAQQIA